jgi:hypothetical protein
MKIRVRTSKKSRSVGTPKSSTRSSNRVFRHVSNHGKITLTLFESAQPPLSRCSLDELEAHAFLKQAKKLGVDSQVFVDNIGRFFGRCQSEETNHAECSIDQIFSSHAVADSNNQCHSINLAWEF